MKRRLFLLSGSASVVATALSACGGGGGGGADVAAASTGTGTETGAVQMSAETSATTTASPRNLGGLPEKILGCYFTAWDTAYKMTAVPAEFNVIYLFHCKPNGTPINGSHNNVGDGSFMFEFFNEVSAADVQACRARGQKVILTVGGAQAGYAWDNRTKSTNFVASFRTIVERLGGVDGIDFNNSEGTIVNAGNIQAVSTEMVWIGQQLRALYGPDFAITSPAGATGTTQEDLMLAMKNGGVLTYAAPQNYDWSGFNAPGYIKRVTDIWCSLLGEEFVGVGLSANYAYGPSLSDCTREWAAIKAAHPKIRGMFCWSAQTNLNGGNTWGQTMKAALV